MNAGRSSLRHPVAGDRGAQFWLWEKSFELAVSVFKIADRIPRELGLALAGQMRMAALSVPSQLSPSKSGGSTREFARGLSVAVNALTEMETQLSLCCELGYTNEMEERRLVLRIRELKRTATRLLRRLRGLLSGNRLQAISDEIAALISEEKEAALGSRS